MIEIPKQVQNDKRESPTINKFSYMSWVIWATIGYFLNAIALAVDKALLNRQELKDPAVYTLLISALGLLVFILAPFGLEKPSLEVLGYGLASGVFFTLGLWLMFTVLRVGEASRVPAFIGSLNPAFVFIVSFFFLGERLPEMGILAFILLVAGGFLMVGGGHGLKGKYLSLGVLSALAFGFAYVFLKITFNETSFISGLIWTRLGSFISSLALFLIPGTASAFGNSFRSQSRIKFAFIGGQTAGAVAGLLNSFAISLASVTLVNALQGVQYVFLLILAAAVSYWRPVFFHDEFSPPALWRKVGGTVMIAIGLGLLSVM